MELMEERVAKALWEAAKENASAAWEGHIPEAKAAIIIVRNETIEECIQVIIASDFVPGKYNIHILIDRLRALKEKP